MNHKIAVLKFPGTNRYTEVCDALSTMGMRPVLTHWNDDAVEKIIRSEGVTIPGGFTYDDHGIAGLVASRNKPIMDAIREKIGQGAPFLGICNGAQIGLEAQLVHAKNPNKIEMALARNRREKDGKILGTGFYDAWVHVKSVQPAGTNAFNIGVPKGTVLKTIVAHGEGNFQMAPATLKYLIENRQIAYRYCDSKGNIIPEYPTNPNGSMYNIAAITNKEGNAMIIMPHPEELDHGRVSDGMIFIIDSMRKYLDSGCKLRKAQKDKVPAQLPKQMEVWKPPKHDYLIEFFVTWLTTDTDGFAMGTMLDNVGFHADDFSREDYWKVYVNGDPKYAKELAERIITSNQIIMTTKHYPIVKLPENKYFVWQQTGKGAGYLAEHDVREGHLLYDVWILTKEKENVVGRSKWFNLNERLGLKDIVGVEFGKLWKAKLFGPRQDVVDYVYDMLEAGHLSNPISMTAEIYRLG